MDRFYKWLRGWFRCGLTVDYIDKAYITITYDKDGNIIGIQPHKEPIGMIFDLRYLLQKSE